MAAPLSLHERLRGFRTLVVLAPHPDDEIFGCFGLVHLARQMGLRIELHIVSDGERCFGALPAREELALRLARQQESCQAAALLGCPAPQFWQLGDSQLMEQMALLERRLQNLWRADALYLAPWQHDGHPDHEAVAHCVRRIAAPQHCIHYPIWALVQPQRRARFLGLRGVRRLELEPAQRALKQQAAALFQTQRNRAAAAEGAILSEQALAAFTTDHEYYLDEN